MRSGARQHPFGHGARLSASERSRLAAIAEGHAHDLGPLLRWPAHVPVELPRRILRTSGWPAWAALLLGLALTGWGARADQGWPVLIGAILALTFNHWLGLPRLGARPGTVPAAGHGVRRDPP